MNYAVYTSRVVDGITEHRIIVYQIVDTEGGRGIAMMDQSAAEALAASFAKEATDIVLVLPLETDQAITAA